MALKNISIEDLRRKNEASKEAAAKAKSEKKG